MTTILLVNQQDVAALKCIYFNLVKELKEMYWYGIDCNLPPQKQNVDSAFIYLQILDTSCDIPHALQCEIKSFITKFKAHCVNSIDPCDRTTIVESYSFLTTEDGDILTTESGEPILV